MINIQLHNDCPATDTIVPNQFIDRFMPSANGEFVKVYLYLLRCIHSHASNCTISEIADKFNNTEMDIQRALRYWQKEGLLSFTEQNGEITSIVLSTDATDTASAVTAEREPDIDASPAAEETVVPDGISIPNRQEYTPLQAEALMKDIEISEAISQAEKILGTTLSTTHLQMILYFMCDIGFSQEMIATLYRTAHSRGKTSPKYMEAIGLTWAKKGITTPEEAKDESSAFSGLYHVVSKALGLNRSLAPAEREIIDTWSDYDFSDEIIEQACKRTVLQTGGTNLNYITSILKDWHKKGVLTLADIEKCDKSFQQKKKTGEQKNSATQQKRNQFQSFPQREYSKEDYSSLEKQLLRNVQA